MVGKIREISFWDIVPGHLFQTGKHIESNRANLPENPKPPIFFRVGRFGRRQSLVFSHHLWLEYVAKCGHPPEVSQETPLKKGGSFQDVKPPFLPWGVPVTFLLGRTGWQKSRHISVDIGSLVLAESRLPNWSTDCILGVRTTRVSVEVIVTD